ncbi:DNA topoisomerase IB [soil metagenome]
MDPAAPGLSRRRRCRGFGYEDARGRAVDDDEVLARIAGHAIPPAWEDVWICRDPLGHLQAAGTDTAGRRQYLYHPAWRERQDTRKFQRVEAFARALPEIRRTVEQDLDVDDLTKRRAMAVAVRLLDRAAFRIGSETYADRNGSFGLATIRKGHVSIEGSTIVFDYQAKSGVRRRHAIDDPELVPVLERLKRRRSGGLELLAYREGGRWRDVRSSDITSYLKDELGQEHSAKDFRTWNASVLAAVDLSSAEAAAHPPASRKRQVTATVKWVAQCMGNTPAVCRASYIDPRVFDGYREGTTIEQAPARIGKPSYTCLVRSAVEEAVLDLLAGARRAAVAA